MMEVSPQLQKALHVGTSLSYSLDMSKFPGLNDPTHQSQPALLIATPESQINSGPDIMSEMIPRPTVDVPASADILEDILSVLENQNSEFGRDHDPKYQSYKCSAIQPAPPQGNQYRLNTGSQVPVKPQQNSMGYGKQPVSSVIGSSKTIPLNTTCMSRYAMDMIFHKLIYPDVSLGQSFNLDTLVQSAHKDYTRTSHSSFRSTYRYVTKENHETGVASALVTGSGRYCKRKRGSDGVHCDHENIKRSRYDTTPNAIPGMCHTNSSPITYPYQQKRLILS